MFGDVELISSFKLKSNFLMMLLFSLAVSLVCSNLNGLSLNSLYCFDSSDFFVSTCFICPEMYAVPACEIIVNE